MSGQQVARCRADGHQWPREGTAECPSCGTLRIVRGAGTERQVNYEFLFDGELSIQDAVDRIILLHEADTAHKTGMYVVYNPTRPTKEPRVTTPNANRLGYVTLAEGYPVGNTPSMRRLITRAVETARKERLTGGCYAD